MPHIRLSLAQQKVATLVEALEYAIRLEAPLVGESSGGMAQVQSQLAVLTLQL